VKLNQNYDKLQENYLFATIDKKIAAHQAAHPGASLIRMGIGDVTLPLCAAVMDAMKQAVEEMARAQTFRGYGPYAGYAFLREAVGACYGERGVPVSPDEVYINDGCKSDMAGILDIFGTDNTVLIPDPVYPVYVDTNIMAGREVLFMDAVAENKFLPLPDPAVHADIIYLCSPNNPTGAVYSKEQLAGWVAYAREHDAVILFDAAYESFVCDPALPRSIFEIPGARECAIEFCSFSKTAGFTGTRCGYTVIPQALRRGGKALGPLWLRRQSTKYNGVPYIVQRGAQAVFSPQGRAQIRQSIDFYMANAAMMAQTLKACGIWFTGGENSPYIWLRCPGGLSSWEYFDLLLEQAGVVGTAGAGFGKNGEGFLRLTAFGGRESTAEGMERITALLHRFPD